MAGAPQPGDGPAGSRGQLVAVLVLGGAVFQLVAALLELSAKLLDIPIVKKSLADYLPNHLPTWTLTAILTFSIVRFLLRRILSGRRGDVAGVPASGATVDNLPPRDRSFSGRADLLARANRSLDAVRGASPRVVVFHGGEGVGRRSLALELAHRRRAPYQVVWWVPAGSPAQILFSLGRLAASLGRGTEGSSAGVVAVVHDELSRRDGWLLVFHGARDAEALRRYIPRRGAGHVVVTSHQPTWTGAADVIPVRPLSLEESRSFLTERTGGGDMAAVHQLAELLGGRSLTLALATGYMEQTAMSPTDYLRRYRRVRRQLADDPRHPRSWVAVVAAYRLTIRELQLSDPQAVSLLRLLAFLDPALPVELLSAGAHRLPPTLKAPAGDQAGLRGLIVVLCAYRLVSADLDGIRVHPLVQEITRDELSRAKAAQWSQRAARLILESMPEEPAQPQHHQRILRLHSQVQALRSHTSLGAVDPVHTLLDGVAVHLGNNAGSRGVLTDAVEHFQALSELAVSTWGPSHPKVGSGLTGLGTALSKAGRPTEARQALEHAESILCAAFGPLDPRVAHTRNNLAIVLRQLGDLPGAKVRLEQAVPVFEAGGQAHRANLAKALANLGGVLARLDDLAGAERLVERALRIERACHGPDDVEVARTQRILAWILYRQRRRRDAWERLRDALRIYALCYGPAHSEFSITSVVLGWVLIRRGRLGDGWQHLQMAQPPTGHETL